MLTALYHERHRMLEETLDLGEVLGSFGTVGDAVVSREGELHDAHGHDLLVLEDGALDDAAHGDYRGLRRVDDRGEALDAEHAHVGDGEGAALVLLGLQPAFAGALGEILGGRGDGGEGLVGRVPYDGRYEALLQGYRHRQVHLLVQLDPLRGPEGVQVRVVPEGQRAGLHDEVVDGELYPLLLELLVELLAQRYEVVHLDLGSRVVVGDLLLGLRHPLADDPTHPARFDELGPRRPGRLGRGLGSRSSFGRLGLRGASVGPGVSPLQGGPHVALDDAAGRARALYPGEVEVVLLGQAPNDGRGPEAAVGPAVCFRLLLGGLFLLRRFRGGRGLGFASFFLTALGLLCLRLAIALWNFLALALDKGYRLADGDVLTLVGDELRERAGVLGLELHRDLVGLDLGYRVALGNFVTLALEPLDEGPLLHRVTHLGHDHFRQLTSPPCKEPDGPRSPPAPRSGRPPTPDSARRAPAPPPRSPSPPVRRGSRRPGPG